MIRARSYQPRGRVKLGPSEMNKACVFALYARQEYDLVSHTVPTRTNVSRDAGHAGIADVFAGGAEGASDLNFGDYGPTRDLGKLPATFSVYASGSDISKAAWACHTDADVAGGWTFGYQSAQTAPGFRSVYSTTDQKIAFGTSALLNSSQQDYAVSLAYDGQPTPNVSVFWNGQTAAAIGGSVSVVSNGSGTPGSGAGQNLYIGRARYNGAQSMTGGIYLVHICSEQWGPDKLKAWGENPWQVFAPDPEVAYAFAYGVGAAGATGSALYFGAGSS